MIEEKKSSKRIECRANLRLDGSTPLHTRHTLYSGERSHKARCALFFFEGNYSASCEKKVRKKKEALVV